MNQLDFLNLGSRAAAPAPRSSILNFIFNPPSNIEVLIFIFWFLLITIIIFLIIRIFVLWYWKINKIVSILEDISYNTLFIGKQIQLMNNNDKKDSDEAIN